MTQSRLIKRSAANASTKQAPPARNTGTKLMQVALKDWVKQHQNAQASNVRAAFKALFVPSAGSKKTTTR